MNEKERGAAVSQKCSAGQMATQGRAADEKARQHSAELAQNLRVFLQHRKRPLQLCVRLLRRARRCGGGSGDPAVHLRQHVRRHFFQRAAQRHGHSALALLVVQLH